MPHDLTSATADSVRRTEQRGPSPVRGVLVLTSCVIGIWALAQYGRGGRGVDEQVTRLGRIEVTARLLSCPDPFPDLGAYRYTYVVPYEVLQVHRQDPTSKYRLQRGEKIFVGHYQPRLSRNKIQDADWGAAPLGGKLTRIVHGDVHRMALDYELAALAPSGTLDNCFPPKVNRFFAIWANLAQP